MRTTLLRTHVIVFSLISPLVVLAVDTDGDGVPDGTDVCCHTPAGVTVDAQGRPKGDLDNDCDVDQSDFAIFQNNMTGPIVETCTPEVCNGVDDDCDCLIDDGANASCPNVTNATGLCASGTCTFSCNAGFGNCDGNTTNGCETNLNNNVNNCGSCGHVCPMPAFALSRTCNGTCGFTCLPGHLDCDGYPANGCETTGPCP